MKAFNWFLLFVFAIPLVLAGCKGNEATSSAEKQYSIRGKVTAVNPDKPSVKLDHEDIPGLMQGMEMEFAVANAKLRSSIAIETLSASGNNYDAQAGAAGDLHEEAPDEHGDEHAAAEGRLPVGERPPGDCRDHGRRPLARHRGASRSVRVGARRAAAPAKDDDAPRPADRSARG